MTTPTPARIALDPDTMRLLRAALGSDDTLTRELARRLAHSLLCWQSLGDEVAEAQRYQVPGGQKVTRTPRLAGAKPGALIAVAGDARTALAGPATRSTLGELVAALEGRGEP